MTTPVALMTGRSDPRARPRQGGCAPMLRSSPPRRATSSPAAIRRAHRVGARRAAPRRSRRRRARASSSRTPARCRRISMLGMTLKSGTRRNHNPWHLRHPMALGTLDFLTTISVPCPPNANIVPSSVLALRREAGGADRRGAGRARSGSAHHAVRSARAAVFDHARVPAVRRARTSTGRSTRRGRPRNIIETGEGADRRYRARFFSSDALQLRDLFELVGPVPGTEVLIDDRPGAVLQRAVAAAALVSPARLTVSMPEAEVGIRAADDVPRGRDPPPRSRVQHVFRRPPAASAMGDARAASTRSSRRHDQSFIRNTADRFRFESLQNRYQKFLELWERQMTNRELGRPMMGEARLRRRRRRRRQTKKPKARAARPSPARSGARARSSAISGSAERSRQAAARAADRGEEAGRRIAGRDRSAGGARQGAGRQVQVRRQGRDVQGRGERRQGVADRDAGERRMRVKS